jgi:hypothetical protein
MINLESFSSFFCKVYGACMSVTLPNITSGWLDAIDQEKLGELHEIFSDYDATAN